MDGRVNFSGQGSNPEMLSLKRQMEDLGLQVITGSAVYICPHLVKQYARLIPSRFLKG